LYLVYPPLTSYNYQQLKKPTFCSHFLEIIISAENKP
jgi:hypothetical protein